MSDVQVETKPTKPPVVITTVVMEDGRSVDFSGNRKIKKEATVEGNTVAVRFDYINGQTKTYVLPSHLVAQAAAHGFSQKLGDTAAGEKELDDAILAIEALGSRLTAEGSTWNAVATGGSGDSFSGASVVIQALVEETGKSVSEIKAFLDRKLEAGKATGLTRQNLYKSFRNPASAIGQLILVLEAQKAAKATGFNADDAMAELNAQ